MKSLFRSLTRALSRDKEDGTQHAQAQTQTHASHEQDAPSINFVSEQGVVSVIGGDGSTQIHTTHIHTVTTTGTATATATSTSIVRGTTATTNTHKPASPPSMVTSSRPPKSHSPRDIHPALTRATSSLDSPRERHDRRPSYLSHDDTGQCDTTHGMRDGYVHGHVHVYVCVCMRMCMCIHVRARAYVCVVWYVTCARDVCSYVISKCVHLHEYLCTCDVRVYVSLCAASCACVC